MLGLTMSGHLLDPYGFCLLDLVTLFIYQRLSELTFLLLLLLEAVSPVYMYIVRFFSISLSTCPIRVNRSFFHFNNITACSR